MLGLTMGLIKSVKDWTTSISYLEEPSKNSWGEWGSNIDDLLTSTTFWLYNENLGHLDILENI